MCPNVFFLLLQSRSQSNTMGRVCIRWIGIPDLLDAPFKSGYMNQLD